jgi:hypothetical protein
MIRISIQPDFIGLTKIKDHFPNHNQLKHSGPYSRTHQAESHIFPRYSSRRACQGRPSTRRSRRPRRARPGRRSPSSRRRPTSGSTARSSLRAIRVVRTLFRSVPFLAPVCRFPGVVSCHGGSDGASRGCTEDDLTVMQLLRTVSIDAGVLLADVVGGGDGALREGKKPATSSYSSSSDEARSRSSRLRLSRSIV